MCLYIMHKGERVFIPLAVEAEGPAAIEAYVAAQAAAEEEEET